MYTNFDKKSYIYRNMPIGGGGFVTGILFHKNAKNRLYIRTDIGGVYRYDFTHNQWVCLCEDAYGDDISPTYPLAIAVDENDKNSLYVACGDRVNNWILVSENCGKSFVRRKIPCEIHGNQVGRATGERLFVSKSKIIFGSQSEGIIVSEDDGKSWNIITVNGEKNISCMWFSEDEKIAIIGCNGEQNSVDGVNRGATLYYSNDNLKSFHILTSPPVQDFEDATYNGYVPQRIASDGKNIYITFSATGKVVFGGMGAYSCDTGNVIDGRILKYEINSDGNLCYICDVTPVDETNDSRKKLNGGYCGICCKDGVVLASTICRHGEDIIYRSFDGGNTWEKILQGTFIGEINWTVSYMKPEYNGNSSCIHWISDIKISPHDSNFAIFNTGTGIFKTNNLQDKTVKFEPFCEGIEETVHMNVYSLPAGKIKVLDLVGDLGGFAFEDFEKPCENTFADENNNRYITCVNADFPVNNPQNIVATPRGNWTGLTKGGLILTKNQCESWTHIACPRGISEKIDSVAERIEMPNNDSGWTAISADGKRISWSIGRECSSDMTIFTDDEGNNWEKSQFFDINANPILEEITVRIYTDYYDENVAFALSNDFRFFLSVDKSEKFFEVDLGLKLRKTKYWYSKIARQPNVSYVFWIPNFDGLHRVKFDKNGNFRVKNILKDKDYALNVGFGKGRTSTPAMYVNGEICGVYGFFMSDDLGNSWTRINDDLHQFGNITSVCGDTREYGRIILGTGTKGLIYGEPL